MATAVRYRVPYEITIAGHDAASGKPSTNLLFTRCGAASGSPPAYGTAIPGSSDIATVLTNYRAAWRTVIGTVMSTHYIVDSYTIRALMGWLTGTIPKPVTGASNTTPITITTSTEHDLSTGQTVTIAGATGNTAANGSWVITVLGPDTFSLNTSVGNGAYTGGATWSTTNNKNRWLYGDTATLAGVAGTDNGGVTGDALPLHVTQSVRRLASTAGRNFRSGIRMSPLPESVWIDGTTLALSVSTQVAAWHTFATTSVVNGGSDTTGSAMMFDLAVSKQLAFMQPTPFTTADPFVSPVSDFVPRLNNGSLRRRKPRLTASISQLT